MASSVMKHRTSRAFLSSVGRHGAGLFGNPGIKFVRDLMVLAGGQFAVKVIGFVTFAWLARVLGPEGYGQVEFLLALTGFAALVIDFGLGPVGVRRQGAGDAETPVHGVPTLRVAIALLTAPAVLAAVFATTPDPTARLLGCLFAASLLLHAFKQEWLLQSMERMGAVAGAQALRVIVFGALVLALVSGVADILWVGVAELVAVAVWIGFYVLAQLRAGHRLRLLPDRAALGGLLREAAPLGLNSIVWGLAQYLPAMLVALISGLEEAAYLAAGQRLVVSLQTLSYTYHFNLYAAMVRRFRTGAEEMVRLSGASLRVVAWAVAGPAALGAVHGAEIMALLFGPAFAAAGLPFMLLVFVFPLQILSGHFRWALTASGHSRSVFLAGLSGAVLAVAAGPALVWQWGALGGAAMALTGALGVLVASALLCRRHGIAIGLAARLARPAAAAALAAALSELLSGLVPEAAWWMRLAAGAGLYGALALLADRSLFPDLRHLAYAKKDVSTGRNV